MGRSLPVGPYERVALNVKLITSVSKKGFSKLGKMWSDIRVRFKSLKDNLQSALKRNAIL